MYEMVSTMKARAGMLVERNQATQFKTSKQARNGAGFEEKPQGMLVTEILTCEMTSPEKILE